MYVAAVRPRYTILFQRVFLDLKQSNTNNIKGYRKHTKLQYKQVSGPWKSYKIVFPGVEKQTSFRHVQRFVIFVHKKLLFSENLLLLTVKQPKSYKSDVLFFEIEA